jgi:murein DD-endopeptidase MepM/ murein hydrolase activator NlpD
MGADRVALARALAHLAAGACAIASGACSAGDVHPKEHLAAVVSAAESAIATPPPADEALKKVVIEEPPAPPWTPADRELSYVLPVDLGIRADSGGDGHFLAPRAHGKHNGIDFLAPVGTPILAACDGKARTDERGGYGRVVQLVCKLPKELGGDEGLYASFFYAHLSKANVGKKWTHVKGGATLGAVGKTGNAKGPKINPHLHLEVIVRGSEKEALEERHAGVVPKANAAADRFFEILADSCLDPAKLASKDHQIRRERRADPFVLLMCASKPKPELTRPDDAKLAAAQVKWSAHYQARGFDVDRGPQ